MKTLGDRIGVRELAAGSRERPSSMSPWTPATVVEILGGAADDVAAAYLDDNAGLSEL
jgi:hypothetical protein